MKNTSYLSALIELMRDATTQTDDRDNKFGLQTMWNDDIGYSSEVNRDILGLTVDDICELTGATFEEGANCQVFVLSDAVVKWYTGRGIHDSDSGSDLQVYRSAVDWGYGKNMARTEVYGTVTVQERIRPYVEVMNTLSLAAQMVLESEVASIGKALNIGDLHEYNWGFRMDDTTYTTPVIFDYSCDAVDDDSIRSRRRVWASSHPSATSSY